MYPYVTTEPIGTSMFYKNDTRRRASTRYTRQTAILTFQLAMSNRNVQDNHQDRQWDARLNVRSDDDLARIVDAIKSEAERGKFQYILIGGVEIGDKHWQDDYQVKHIHVAAIFTNRVTKRSILNNWAVRPGDGYYLVPRNRDLPYSGWRSHHTKEKTKLHPEQRMLFEMGTLPQDPVRKEKPSAAPKEKKRKLDDILPEIKQLIEEDREDEAEALYPAAFYRYGENIKSRMAQTKRAKTHSGDPHIWVYGYAGTGKTAILNYIYPTYYKKNLYNKFFDLYDEKIHTHVMLEDFDHAAMERLTVNFMKTLCDEVGFAVDQKYKSPQLSRTSVLVTSNFPIRDLLKDLPGVEQNYQALKRRFLELPVYKLLQFLGMKLVDKEVRNALSKEGNADISKIFIGWDYVQDFPTGKPIKTPEECRKVIKDYFYSQ